MCCLLCSREPENQNKKELFVCTLVQTGAVKSKLHTLKNTCPMCHLWEKRWHFLRMKSTNQWASQTAADCLIRHRRAALMNVTRVCQDASGIHLCRSQAATHHPRTPVERSSRDRHHYKAKRSKWQPFHLCEQLHLTLLQIWVLLISVAAEGEQKHNHCLINCPVAMTTG